MAIHKHQPGAGQAAEGKFGDGVRGDFIRRALEHGLERQPGDAGDVGEAPIFVVERRAY